MSRIRKLWRYIVYDIYSVVLFLVGVLGMSFIIFVIYYTATHGNF